MLTELLKCISLPPHTAIVLVEFISLGLGHLNCVELQVCVADNNNNNNINMVPSNLVIAVKLSLVISSCQHINLGGNFQVRTLLQLEFPSHNFLEPFLLEEFKAQRK